MTVVNPKSISGINSITTGSGSDNLLTIHTSDASNTERVRINSSGDVIVGSGITVSPDGDIFATGVTTSTTFVGALTGNVTGNISGGTVAGSTGTFSAAVSGTTGTFSGAISGTTGTFSSHVSLGDNDQLRIGDGDDLQIYHDASNTVLVNNTGDLYIQNDSSNDTNKILIRPKAGEASIECVPNAEVSLFHNNVKQFFTTTTGVKMESSSDLNIHLLKTGSQDTLIQNTGQTEICAATGGASGQRIVFRIGANTGSMPEIARFTPDGLCFGSDTAAANALDDYETGTYTITATLGSGSVSSYTSNTGRYIKIGSVVHVVGRLHVNTSTSNVTSFSINLPFTNEAPNYADTSCVCHVIRANGGDPVQGVRLFRIAPNTAVATMNNHEGQTYGDLGATDAHININFTYNCVV